MLPKEGGRSRQGRKEMRKLAVALLGASLVACSGGDNEDLRQWMNEATKDIKGTIPPRLQVKPYESVPYDAGNLVDRI